MARLERLSKSFKPQTYDLKLQASPNSSEFSGELKITGFKTSRPSYRIVLNQHGLKVTSAKLKFQPKNPQELPQEVPIKRIVHHTKLSELRLHTETQLLPGKYVIELNYSASISDSSMQGIYFSSWHDESDNLQKIITTQLEPHYARRLLPCIDDPAAKAVFNLQLNLPKENSAKLKALFNTPITSDTTTSDFRELKFEPTPLMSTYLLALVVGELSSIEAKTKRGILVRVTSVPSKVEDLSFALEFATRVLDFLEDYFKTDYPLSKLDLVAIPDFDAGGMENWGLMTFREELLLFNPELSTLSDKQSIALVVAHEVAHQWFGNLVTMAWWDELWLNEGFANFMENLIVDRLFPEWKVLEAYIAHQRPTAIRLDSLPSSRPIINKVHKAHQAEDAFDEIAYEKSGSIVRMIYSMVGEESFQLSLKDYFSKYKFKNATSLDLITCWDKYTKLNLAEFCSSWLNTPGLPVLNAKLEKDTIELSQSRFLSKANTNLSLESYLKSSLANQKNLSSKLKQTYINQQTKKYHQDKKRTWPIPIDFVLESSLASTSSTKKEVKIMSSPELKLKFQGPTIPLKLNKSANNFYITNYCPSFLAQIVESIKLGRLQDADILNALSDLVLLNKTRQLELGPALILDTLQANRTTLNPNFWSLAGSYLGYLHQHLKDSNQHKELHPYINSLIREALAKLKFDFKEGEDASITSARFEVLALGVLAGNKELTSKLLEIYDNSDSIDDLEPEQRALILYTVAKRGTKKDYNKLLATYQEVLEDPILRDDISCSLCGFEDPDLIKLNFSKMQYEDQVRQQDIISWLYSLSGTSQGSRQELKSWLKKDEGWAWLVDNLSPADLSSSVRVVLSTVDNKPDLTKLKEFLIENTPSGQLDKAIKEAEELSLDRLAWHQYELPKLKNYLTAVK